MPAKVLIAEDDPSIVESLEFLLRRAGHEVMVACDGAVALRLARTARPDLIVLDVMLPVVSGLDVCRQVRLAGGAAGAAGILLLTARGQESEIRSGLDAGADAYMTKPFSTRELVETVARLLRNR